jgi:hypothetical protein
MARRQTALCLLLYLLPRGGPTHARQPVLRVLLTPFWPHDSRHALGALTSRPSNSCAYSQSSTEQGRARHWQRFVNRMQPALTHASWIVCFLRKEHAPRRGTGTWHCTRAAQCSFFSQCKLQQCIDSCCQLCNAKVWLLLLTAPTK